MPTLGRVLRVAALGTAVVSIVSGATPARAQGHDKVAAEALFEEGRRLLAAGNVTAACPKFADSERLDPSPSTLLNLANCYEKSGRSATAWATYREAASAASAAGRADYTTTAQRHADLLAPKLPRLSLRVEGAVAGLQITRDGERVDSAAWGAPIPIDPGTHTIEASAPGFKGWASSVSAQDGLLASVTVPALEPMPAGEAPPVVTPLPSPPVAPSPVDSRLQGAAPVSAPSPSSSGGGQRTVGVVMGVAGLVGLGLGGTFSILAKNKYNSSLANCETNNAGLCNAVGVSERNSARGMGTAATVTTIAGAAVLVGGFVVWITGPRGDAGASTTGRLGIAPAPGGAVLVGAF